MSAIEPSRESGGFRVRGWHVAAGVSAFFAVVIGVDAAFTVLALKTFPGQVSVTPYEDGLLYNRQIAQLEAQDRLGWRAGAMAEPGLVTVEIRDAEGRPLRGLSLSGRLQRPATDAGKISPRFVEAAPGRYEAATGAITGTWDVIFEARDAGGRRFAGERRLTWP